MKQQLENIEVIIIGGNHINALGVMRSLGEKGIKSFYIMTSPDQSYCKKCKYIKKYWAIKEEENEILNILRNEINFRNKRIYLIPTSDFAAFVLDKNFNELSKKYILPNIDNKEGEILKYMNKNNQLELAKNNGLKVAKSLEVDLNNLKLFVEDNKIYPCIVKPLISAGHEKSDITICSTKKELMSCLENLKNKKYKKVLFQEFLFYDFECDINGFSCKEQVIIPAITKKENVYPKKKGSTSCGTIKSKEFINVNKIESLMKKLNYNGIFDIEILVSGNDFYLNEINFRNGANSYSLSIGNMNTIYSWILLNEKIPFNLNSVEKEYMFVIEDMELRSLLKKEITIKEFIKHFFKGKKMILRLNDIKPFIYKIIYIIKRKMFKEK